MKTNIIASNTVLAVLPNMKPTSKSWDEIKTRTLVSKKPVRRSHTMMITITTTAEASIFKSSTAVLVSFSECMRDLRPRYTFTWKQE